VTFDQLLHRQRTHIDSVIYGLARRHYLASAELEEFRGAVDRALERNDFELLRAFDGRSTWETYLTTVITRQFYLFQGALWGQWRPTPGAVRHGPAAVLLEELVVRNRFPLHDAIDWMREAHRVDYSRHKLTQLAEQLGLPGAGVARRARAVQADAPSPEIKRALDQALALVSPDDRLMLELRFRDGQPLTRIAALLKMDARPLQRRIDTALKVIRDSLIAQGLAADLVERTLRNAERDAAGAYQSWWDSVFARPSIEARKR
jgi:DNA-directed RNA polymerase specialized sigma24 family protein